MKTIGVLGGLGPQATIDFERRVHEVSQRLIPQLYNTGYPPMFVSYFRDSPIRLDERGEPLQPIEPEPKLFEAAASLGRVADFLVIPSNGVHLMQEEIEKAAGKPVLSMIDATMDEVRRRNYRRVGVLGLGEPHVYQHALAHANIECDVLPPAERDQLDNQIIALMEGRDGPETKQATLEAVESLRRRKVHGIILGCTEIPLLLGADADREDCINPAALLAERAVRRACGQEVSPRSRARRTSGIS